MTGGLRGQTADRVQLLVCDGEPVRMIEAWTGASLAVVIDAVLADPPVPGRLHRITVDRAEFADRHPVSSHGLSLGASIGLAKALGRMPDRLIIHAVEAADQFFHRGLAGARGPEDEQRNRWLTRK